MLVVFFFFFLKNKCLHLSANKMWFILAEQQLVELGNVGFDNLFKGYSLIKCYLFALTNMFIS